MTFDDAKLMAYADGELSPEERAEIERAAAGDADLRARIDAHLRLRASISNAFDGVLDEPVPEALTNAARAGSREAAVIDLSQRRAMRPAWSAREWSAMAASVAGGLLIGLGVMNTQSPPIAVTADGMSARGALARALNTQLAADEGGAVRIGLSFRAQDGGYCRTFELTRRGTAGIACRDQEHWSVALTAAQTHQGEVRMAAASEAILDAVDAMIVGDPLDAEAEAEARARRWRAD